MGVAWKITYHPDGVCARPPKDITDSLKKLEIKRDDLPWGVHWHPHPGVSYFLIWHEEMCRAEVTQAERIYIPKYGIERECSLRKIVGEKVYSIYEGVI